MSWWNVQQYTSVSVCSSTTTLDSTQKNSVLCSTVKRISNFLQTPCPILSTDQQLKKGDLKENHGLKTIVSSSVLIYRQCKRPMSQQSDN